MAAKTRRLDRRTVAALDCLDAMWAGVDAHKSNVLLTRPKNSFTIAEFAARYGVTTSAARDRLARMVEDGTITKYTCLIQSGGTMRPTNVYTAA